MYVVSIEPGQVWLSPLADEPRDSDPFVVVNGRLYGYAPGEFETEQEMQNSPRVSFFFTEDDPVVKKYQDAIEVLRYRYNGEPN